ncbi:MAG TPA: hypothetical protein VF815_28335, partial [Myxococcaceae bacterium]
MACLPLDLEADPSGLTERAPVIASLLPDEALSLALARGDAHAVHATLTTRLEHEPSGPTRDTLQQVLAQRELFAVAESTPRLGEILGTGIALVQRPEPGSQQGPFISTRAVRVLGLPIWPLGQHLVRQGRNGQLEVLGRVPSGSSLGVMRAVSLLAAGAVLLAGVTAGLLPLVLHEVTLVNGLSRAVEVRLDDRAFTVEPGDRVQQQVFSLTGPQTLEARWPGEASAFEQLPVEGRSRLVYNILGAASVRVDDSAEQNAPRLLSGPLDTLWPGEELISWKSGWERTVSELADAGRWEQAASVAQGVALADPTALGAREQGLRLALRHKRDLAEKFAWRLTARYPEDPTAHHLAQDALVAMGRGDFARKRYAEWAAEAPDNPFRALLHARSLPPEEHPEAYARVREQFPGSAEVRLALARIQLEQGTPEQALE